MLSQSETSNEKASLKVESIIYTCHRVTHSASGHWPNYYMRIGINWVNLLLKTVFIFYFIQAAGCPECQKVTKVKTAVPQQLMSIIVSTLHKGVIVVRWCKYCSRLVLFGRIYGTFLVLTMKWFFAQCSIFQANATWDLVGIVLVGPPRTNSHLPLLQAGWGEPNAGWVSGLRYGSFD